MVEMDCWPGAAPVGTGYAGLGCEAGSNLARRQGEKKRGEVGW